MKMEKRAVGRPSKPVEIDGVTYPSLGVAAVVHGISRTAMRYRLDAMRFPKYEIMDNPKISGEKFFSLLGIRFKNNQDCAERLGLKLRDVTILKLAHERLRHLRSGGLA
jgi:hypothetical protein